jgi:hypothetical protein
MSEPEKPTPSRPASPVRVWAERISLMLIGLLMGVIGAEVMLRLMAYKLPVNLQLALQDVKMTPFGDTPVIRPSILRQDNYFGMITRPGAVDLIQYANAGVTQRVTTINWLDPNSHVGFRVPSTDWQPRWPVDVVAVGDSFTYCITEWEDCWVERLSSDYGLSVVNLGTPATGSVSHQRMLDTFGLAYEPRIVVWQWFGNDSFDDYWLSVYSGEIVPENNPLPPERVLSDFLPARFVQENSALYAIAYSLITSPSPGYVSKYHVQDGDLSLDFGTSDGAAAFDMGNAENTYGWERTKQAIIAARDELSARDIALVIVLIPTKEEVYEKWTRPVLGDEQMDMAPVGRRMMIEFCAEEKLACLDMTDALLEHSSKAEQIYWVTDFHLNPAGNKIVADALYDYLGELGLLPPQ